MSRTKIVNKTAAAAVVLAAVSGVAGIAGIAGVGCRAFPRAVFTGESAPIAAAANAQSAAVSGVEAVKVHTAIAQELVEQALPNSNPVGQAQLSAAGVEHQAVISSADKTAESLDQLRRSFAQASRELAESQRQVADAQEKQRKLEQQWYVLWGLRIEKAFWTIAISWLLVSAGSMLLGAGNPIRWISALRNGIATTRQRWIGEAFVK